MAKKEKKWRHSSRGRIGQNLEDNEYGHTMRCVNCGKEIGIAIQKGTGISDVVDDVDCPNCGIVQYGASKQWRL